MKRLTRWIAVAVVAVAIGGGAYGVSQLGAGEQDGAPASAESSSPSTKPDDGRAGGTPDEHIDKPGESK